MSLSRWRIRPTLWCLCVATSVLLLSGCDLFTSSGSPSETSRDRYLRVGYILGQSALKASPSEARRRLALPDRRRTSTVRLAAEAADRLTHLNYAFANVTKRGRVVLERRRDSVNLMRLGALRDDHPDLKLLLSIGGWAWSDYFSNAALTDASRRRFARSAVRLLDTYNLDGLDINWEFPGRPGQDNIHRSEDAENFTRLLRTVRAHLKAQGKADGRTGEDRYLLTVAAGATRQYLRHTNMTEAHKPLDFINLMTYNFRGRWSLQTGHHANLRAPADVPQALSAAASVEMWTNMGIPTRKLVLGVPFYGRGWGGVRSSNRGLHQPYDKALGAFSYETLAQSYVNQRGFARYWDASAQAPYLWSPDSLTFISYENPRSVRAKADFVRSRGLGGLMYWQHTHDTGALLKALDEGLTAPS